MTAQAPKNKVRIAAASLLGFVEAVRRVDTLAKEIARPQSTRKRRAS